MGVTVEKCLQAWTNSLYQMNAKADVVFFGDSLIYYGDFASVFPDKVVCNLGLRGDTIQGMIDRVEQVRILQPTYVYLMAGINDVAFCSLDCFERKYNELIQRIKQLMPAVCIVIFSMLPVNNILFDINCNNEQICSCNRRIEKIAVQNSLRFVDLFSIYEKDEMMPIVFTKDGIHLSDRGYKKWYSVMCNC